MFANSSGYPGRGQCEKAIEECLHKEVLDSIKECLWFKQPPTLLETEQKQLLADASWPDSCMEFTALNHNMYEKFAAVR